MSLDLKPLSKTKEKKWTVDVFVQHLNSFQQKNKKPPEKVQISLYWSGSDKKLIDKKWAASPSCRRE